MMLCVESTVVLCGFLCGGVCVVLYGVTLSVHSGAASRSIVLL